YRAQKTASVCFPVALLPEFAALKDQYLLLHARNRPVVQQNVLHHKQCLSFAKELWALSAAAGDLQTTGLLPYLYCRKARGKKENQTNFQTTLFRSLFWGA